MDIRKLQRAIVDGLEDVKAQDIAVFNTEAMSPLFERVIIASGTSNRQTKALAASVRDTVKQRGMEVLRTEGEDNGEWIIVDCGAAVAHIMQPAIREYYHLEEIWGDKPVRMKVAPAARGLPKASEPPAAATAPAKSSTKTPTKAPKAPPKTATRTAPAKGASRSPGRAPAKAAARAPAKAPAPPAGKTGAKTGTKTGTKAGAKAAGRSAAKSAAKSAAGGTTRSSATKAAPKKAATRPAPRKPAPRA